jgi:hypothetical protein
VAVTLALPALVLGLFANAEYAHAVRLGRGDEAVQEATDYLRVLARTPSRTGRSVLILAAPLLACLWVRSRRAGVVTLVVIILALADRVFDRSDFTLGLIAFASLGLVAFVERLSPRPCPRPARAGSARSNLRSTRRVSCTGRHRSSAGLRGGGNVGRLARSLSGAQPPSLLEVRFARPTVPRKSGHETQPWLR